MEFSLDSLQPKERASFALRALYEAAGCRKYHMGRFEEYGLYQENRSFLSSEQVITFTDLDGRLLALKPDVTLSIAKTAQPAPGETLRYYYHENVYAPRQRATPFRRSPRWALRCWVRWAKHRCSRRSGWQRRAWPSWGPRGCWKSATWAICSACSTYWACRRMPAPACWKSCGKKNAHELRRAAQAAGLDAAGAAALTGLLELSGSCEETLAKAESACRKRPDARCRRRAAGTGQNAGGLRRAVRLDLSLAGEMEYYNGLVFQGYLQGLPRPCSRAAATTC